MCYMMDSICQLLNDIMIIHTACHSYNTDYMYIYFISYLFISQVNIGIEP